MSDLFADIPDDVIYIILMTLRPQYFPLIPLLSNRWYNIYNCYRIKDVDVDKKIFQAIYHHINIIDAIAGILGYKNIVLLPRYKIIGYHGDYLDNVRHENLTDVIMRGTDNYSRSFITLKMTFIDERGSETKFTEVLFQRYTDDKKYWTSASCPSGHWTFMFNGSRFQESLFRELIETKQLTVGPHNNVSYTGTLYLR